MKQLFSIISLSGLLAISSTSWGTMQIKTNGQVPSIAHAVQLDGTIDAKEWENALQIPLLYETSPAENQPAPVETTAYLMEDGHHLYVAFKASDPEPDKIRAFLRDRDSLYQDDFVGIAIDTFNDKKRAFEFFVNPLGVQADLINDDILRTESDAWNAIWQSEGTITPDGYEVELAIPFGALRFEDGNSMKTWGVDLIRIYPRGLRHRFSNNPQDRNKSCYLCQFSAITGFDDAEPGRNMTIVPTMTVMDNNTRETDPVEDWEGDTEQEYGVDFQWGINSNNVINGTINPDFSQVEADSAQLNINSQFSLYFPEKRHFFLEGADYFNSHMRIVHTRNIADPDFGFKYTGKNDGHTFGFIAANDTETNILLPGSQESEVVEYDTGSVNTVTRYQMDLGKSSIGLLSTSRTADDYANYTLGLDGKVRLGDQDSIEYQLVYSDTANPAILQEEHDLAPNQAGQALKLRYRHDARDWSWYAGHDNIHEDFRADMGFVSRVNYDFSVLGIRRLWHRNADDFFREIGMQSDIDITHDQSGQILEKEREIFAWFHMPMQSVIDFTIVDRERFFEGIMYDQLSYRNYMHTRPWAGLMIGARNFWGDDIDFTNGQQGNSLTSQPFISYRIGQHIELRWNHRFQKFNVRGNRLFTARINDIRMTYQFDERSSLRVTVQSSRVDRDLSLYDEPEDFDAESREVGTKVIYTYKLNSQTAVYLGYSDLAIEDDVQDDLFKTSRSVFAKFSYAWLM